MPWLKAINAAFAVLLALGSSLSMNGCYSSIRDHDADVDTRSDPVFVDPIPDSGCNHPICDILPQCGCPAGYMCSYSQETGRVCVPSGDLHEGDPCAPFDCSPGLLCIDGLCRQACYGDTDCAGSQDCHHDVPGDPIMLCNLSCDLLDPAGCAEGFKCDFYHSDPDDEYYSDCVPLLVPGQVGDECEYYWDLQLGSRDCDIGSICGFIIEINEGRCIEFCPEADAGTISAYCGGIFTCCDSITVAARANGIAYHMCGPELACTSP